MIRQADPPRDAAACAAIYAPYVTDSAISFEAEPPGAVEMEQRIRGIQAALPWLVAERDGRVVGYAYASPHHERAAYRWATDVAVYLDAGHHRRGIGRSLYESLFALLREQGLLVACAGVTLPNDASVALHESLGFEPVGVYRRIGWKAGKWHDVGWWQLRLGEIDGPPPEPQVRRWPGGPDGPSLDA